MALLWKNKFIVPSRQKTRKQTKKFFQEIYKFARKNWNLEKNSSNDKSHTAMDSIASGVSSLLNVSSPHVKKLLNWKQGKPYILICKQTKYEPTISILFYKGKHSWYVCRYVKKLVFYIKILFKIRFLTKAFQSFL